MRGAPASGISAGCFRLAILALLQPGAAGGGIFAASLDVSQMFAMLICLIVFTLIWEEGTEHLEHKLALQEHYMAMLSKVYRELMILGFISLSLVLSLEFDLWHKFHIDHSWLISFEFAHLLIFGVSIVYVVVTIVSSHRLNATKKEWLRIANLKPDTVVEELQARNDADTESWAPLWQSMVPFWDGKDIWEDAEWIALGGLFKKEFKLGKEFDYSKYMKYKIQHKLGHSLHVHPWAWCIIIVMSLLFISGKALAKVVSDGGDVSMDSMSAAAKADLGTNPNTTFSRAGCDDIIEKEEDAFAKADDEVPIDYFGMVVSCLLGWALFFTQLAMLCLCKSDITKVLAVKGCKSAKELPGFVSYLDAEIEVRSHLPYVKMFVGMSGQFLDAVTDLLEIEYFEQGQDVFTEGDPGHSMFFICKGHADVVSVPDDNKILGTLGPGDYVGEMALLLGQPRSKSVVANSHSTVFELTADQLSGLEEEFPENVAKMREFAEERASAGGFTKAATNKPTDEDKVKAQSKGMKAKPGGHGHGGFPGMGGGAAHAAPDSPTSPSDAHGHGDEHGHGGHHVHGPALPGAEHIMNDTRESIYDGVTEVVMLLNCHYVTYYALRLATVMIPKGWKWAIMHVVCLLPIFLLNWVVSPAFLKYYTLLENVLYKDPEIIAEVYHELTRMISLKNGIKKTLVKHGLSRTVHDGEGSIVKVIAEYLYNTINNKGEEISYKELKVGLNEFGVYMTSADFRALCAFVDPDQSGSISLEEWLNFVVSSDDDLENDEWKDEAAGVKLRHKVQKAILGEAMEQQGAANGEMIEHRSISETLMDIFDDIDKDGGGSLELDELKEGLRRHGGLEDLKDEEIERLAKAMDPKGSGEAISRDLWSTFMQDEETPGNAKQEKRLAKKAKRDDKQAFKVSKNENKLVANPVLLDADVEGTPSDDENPKSGGDVGLAPSDDENPKSDSFDAEATVE